jgi:hypothetical protein
MDIPVGPAVPARRPRDPFRTDLSAAQTQSKPSPSRSAVKDICKGENTDQNHLLFRGFSTPAGLSGR